MVDTPKPEPADVDYELRCIMALADLGITPQPGETALDAVLRTIAAADPLLRPYRYEQVDGMRGAFQAWITATGRRTETADTLNTFQAGYTARAQGVRG